MKGRKKVHAEFFFLTVQKMPAINQKKSTAVYRTFIISQSRKAFSAVKKRQPKCNKTSFRLTRETAESIHAAVNDAIDCILHRAEYYRALTEPRRASVCSRDLLAALHSEPGLLRLAPTAFRILKNENQDQLTEARKAEFDRTQNRIKRAEERKQHDLEHPEIAAERRRVWRERMDNIRAAAKEKKEKEKEKETN